MKSCNTCKHKEISVRYLPCRICTDYCLWDMPTSYKEIFVEELEEIKAEIQNRTITKTIVEDSVGMAYCKSRQSIILEDEALEIIDKRISELKGETE